MISFTYTLPAWSLSRKVPVSRPQPSTPAKPYLLYVGAIEPRKNLPLLVAAWSELRRTHDVDLVLVGHLHPDAPPIPPDLLRGELPDSDLPALYSNALAVCYPSSYEGFGLPVLEAMACGATVITSNDPAIVEVSGDAAIHLDPDPRQWLEALAAVAGGLSLRNQALRRAALYTWERTAQLTYEVYCEAIRRF